MKLSVIIPVHNEAATILEVVERLTAVPAEKEIVIVDDCSYDGSSELIDKFAGKGIIIARHKTNKGKGAAIATGLTLCSGDVVVVQDADLEYDPYDLLKLMEPIRNNRADVVYGVRSLVTQRPIMRFGNNLVTTAANLLYRGRLKDMETCYKMMRRHIALGLNLECKGFDVEAEITAKLFRAGIHIHQIPISYHARYKGKKLSPLDGLPAIRALWKYRNWNYDKGPFQPSSSGSNFRASGKSFL